MKQRRPLVLPSLARLSTGFVLALALIWLSVLATESNARGWSWDWPPGYVRVSAKRNNVFYVGEPVGFRLSSAVARFEVRDYFGTVIDSGSINGTRFNVKASAPGWYKLYLYGDRDQGEPWGQVVGGTNFVIFRKNSNFPEMPKSFEDGEYVIWDVKGHVKIRVTNIQENLSNAVINGVFFGMPNVTPSNLDTRNAARFVGTDAQTHGNWKGIYGSEGFNVIGETAKYPSYATVVPSGHQTFTWEQTTEDVRGLQKSSASDRVVSCWYSGANFVIDVNIKDGLTHRLALYALDWDGFGPRAETIEVLDGDTGAVLAKHQLGSINKGVFESEDQVMRGVTGMGPQRHYVEDASNPDADIARLKRMIAIDKEMYLPYDPLRKRKLMIAFPNGTENLAGVRKVVEAFKDDVEYFEPRNEPNFTTSGSEFVTKELIPFYRTIKGVDARLKVMGPGIVTIGPGYGLWWIDDFLRAGGGNYIDAFSFHAYNNVNGDFSLTYSSFGALNTLLTRYGVASMEKWQTEQGYPAALYGSYQPRLQGRWTMVQMMAFEQLGIPKEHNHIWYDRSHGFWDVPMWWENEDTSLNPAAPLMRIWSEELYGTTFAKAYDFGMPGNQLYVGSLFSGPGKSVAAFMSAGSTDGKVDLAVTGGASLRCVTAFGVESDLAVTGGRVSLPVTELPVYVELKSGQSISVIPTNFGSNLAVQSGVKATSSGTGVHPIDPNLHNGIDKIRNGALENWYFTQTDYDHPWMDNTAGRPAWVELAFPAVQTIDRILVYAVPPWQWEGTLLDYELQYESAGKWITLERVKEPAKTFKVYTPNVRCTVDSFFSDRWVFQHSFTPVQTQKIRLLVHDVTWGGGATQDVYEAGGQTGAPQIALREIEVYNSSGTGTPSGGSTPGSGGNKAPSVAISSPADKTQLSAPGSIAIQADATDPDGTVNKVEFFSGATKLGETTTAPYVFRWDNIPAGAYVVTAKVYDNGGASAVSAPVNVTVTSTSTAASAKFLKSDLTTQGNWKGRYGKEGVHIAGEAAISPTYATVTANGALGWTWSASTADPRAPQRASAPDRVAACWYSPGLEVSNSFVLDVNVTDGKAHQIALYALDWDGFGPRAETIQMINAQDGSILAQQSLQSFTQGQYLVWEISGHVWIKVVNAKGNANAVVNALFFDPAGETAAGQIPEVPVTAASATFVKADTDTQGDWTLSYGSDGFSLASGVENNSSYAVVKRTGDQTYQWTAAASERRALESISTPGRLAGCWYSASGFALDLSLTDGQQHRVALYMLDWDYNGPRIQTIEVLDAASGTVLDRRSVSSFGKGQYLLWDLKGDVRFRVTNDKPGSNAVINGIFFGGAGRTTK